MEERLGVRLLNRSSRRFSVTDTGRRFYDRCVAMLGEAEAAEQVIAQVRAEPRGVVRMSCPIGLLNFQFGALIAKFMVANPAVEVHLESTNRPVDVIAEGFDVAIRVRFPPLEPTGLVMRRLDEATQCLFASRALIRTPLSSPSSGIALRRWAYFAAAAAFSIWAATSPAWDRKIAWLPTSSMVWDWARFAMNLSRSGLIIRSRVAITV